MIKTVSRVASSTVIDEYIHTNCAFIIFAYGSSFSCVSSLILTCGISFTNILLEWISIHRSLPIISSIIPAATYSAIAPLLSPGKTLFISRSNIGIPLEPVSIPRGLISG